MDRKLVLEVRRRAGHRCEYCHTPESCSSLRHVVDHVIPRQHHGATVFENLALSCGQCNRHKGPNLSGVDPETNRVISLFNPRGQRWAEHFRWDGATLVGTSDTGRVTVYVLAINHGRRVDTRLARMATGEFPRDFE